MSGSRLIVAFALLTLIAMAFSFLALADIYHGGEDLSLEWRVLQASFLIQLAFVGVVLASVARQRPVDG